MSRQPSLHHEADWENIHARLAALERASSGSTLSEARARELLEGRARALASLPPAHETRAMLSLITFTLQQEVYAVESRLVREVCRIVDLTPLPGAASPLAGLTVWRGALLPVIDLRRLLGLNDRSVTERPTLVILDDGEEGGLAGIADAAGAVGIIAGTPGELCNVPISAMQPAPDGMVAAAYVRGLLGDGTIVWDAKRMLEIVGSESV